MVFVIQGIYNSLQDRQAKQLTNNVLIEVFGLVKMIISINLIVKPNIALILYLI